MLLESVGRGRGAGSEHDERLESLAVLLVVDPEHAGLGDVGVGGQCLLHLDRVDVLSPGDDHLVVSPDHEQPPRLIEITDVARRHEALVEVFGVPGGVAVELRGVADVDTADLAGGKFAQFSVENQEFSSAGRSTCGVRGSTQVLRSGGGDHSGFGGVVVVVDDVAETVHELYDDVRAHPRTGGRRKAQRAAAVFVEDLFGQFDDAVEHHRHYTQSGGAVPIDEIEGGFRVELATRDDRAGHRCCEGELREPPGVEHRSDDDDGLLCAPRGPVEYRLEHARVAAGMLGALRCPGGAGRKQDHVTFCAGALRLLPVVIGDHLLYGQR